MGLNFKIFMHRNKSDLHLKLRGDFDGSSAFELLNTLDKYYKDKNKVFIHTDCLDEIFPFGRDTFRNNLPKSIYLSDKLIIMGSKAGKLYPN